MNFLVPKKCLLNKQQSLEITVKWGWCKINEHELNYKTQTISGLFPKVGRFVLYLYQYISILDNDDNEIQALKILQSNWFTGQSNILKVVHYQTTM